MTEQLLAVGAAEQQHEALQILAQLGNAVGGVANGLCQRRTEAGRVPSEPRVKPLSVPSV
jgi:hypothetical protein